MNDVPPGSPSAIDLRIRTRRRGLPVAFRPEAVAVGHHPLDPDPGQLLEPAEVLERVGERPEAAVLHERPQARLDPGRRPQLGVPVAARPQRRRHVVGVVVGVDEVVDRRVADGRDPIRPAR